MKNFMSSDGVVVTDLDGGSSLWPVKGIEVSIVNGVSESVEKGRWWGRSERGLRRVAVRWRLVSRLRDMVE